MAISLYFPWLWLCYIIHIAMLPHFSQPKTDLFRCSKSEVLRWWLWSWTWCLLPWRGWCWPLQVPFGQILPMDFHWPWDILDFFWVIWLAISWAISWGIWGISAHFGPIFLEPQLGLNWVEQLEAFNASSSAPVTLDSCCQTSPSRALVPSSWISGARSIPKPWRLGCWTMMGEWVNDGLGKVPKIWVWVKIRYPNNWMVNTKLD